MRIDLLGSGGFHPSERRHTLCVLLRELGVLLDAGSGAFRVHGRLETPELDVFLTHAHLDHVVGLPTLLGLEHEGRPAPVRLHGAPRALRAVREAVFAAPLFPVPVLASYHELGAGPITLRGGATLRSFPLVHPGGSLGVRIDWRGRSMALVTDTTAPGPATIDAIRGVDLLLHEAYFGEGESELAELTGHCTARQAAETAAAAGAGRLVLVHRDPRAADDTAPLAEARAIFPDAAYGEDGQTLVVG